MKGLSFASVCFLFYVLPFMVDKDVYIKNINPGYFSAPEQVPRET